MKLWCVCVSALRPSTGGLGLCVQHVSGRPCENLINPVLTTSPTIKEQNCSSEAKENWSQRGLNSRPSHLLDTAHPGQTRSISTTL
ncbi:hypothetical protein GE09DRAFT_388249 [Coniochaeta sp. 2T2.1]|nr:hypothetical protein GE09DRAFT_388249 [Coniochaeta sp. 2T2.1]